MPLMDERERRQQSREFGIKLATLLQNRAYETRREHGLDPRYVMRGAADYLRERAEIQINPPLDNTLTDPDQRRN
jgi:hypothetical protein